MKRAKSYILLNSSRRQGRKRDLYTILSECEAHILSLAHVVTVFSKYHDVTSQVVLNKDKRMAGEEPLLITATDHH
jgi:hypothetical protein